MTWLDWGLNPRPPQLDASTLPLGYRPTVNVEPGIRMLTLNELYALLSFHTKCIHTTTLVTSTDMSHCDSVVV